MLSFFDSSSPLQQAVYPYVITMLGTDTNYQPSNQQKHLAMRNQSIPYTELLGFISEQMITTHQKCVSNFNPFDDKPRKPRYRLDGLAVTVINGPDTPGHKVNHRIAMGLHESLRAIYNGHQEINFIAHSRGAVESIIVAHEIQRIQLALKESDVNLENFRDIYCKSPQPKISECLSTLFPENLSAVNPEEFQTFLENLKNVRVHIFAIDPVPGGEFETVLNSITWWPDHGRYLIIPEIVRNYTQILLENDHSVGFRTIYPLHNYNTTHFNVINLLGAHGTASGNPYKHDDSPPIKDENEIRDCQYIAMAHMVDFLEKNKVQFKPCGDETIFLAPIFNQYNRANLVERKCLKLEYYQGMIKNIKSYHALQSTSYTKICENVVARAKGKSNNYRYLYQLEDNRAPSSPKAIQQFFPEYLNENERKIVNYEHAVLVLGLPNLNEEDIADIDTIAALSNILNESLNEEKNAEIHENLKITKCLESFDWLLSQVKLKISLLESENDVHEEFSFISKYVDERLSRECASLNPLECLLMHKIFPLYMSMQILKLNHLEQNKSDALQAILVQLHNGYKQLNELRASESLDDIRNQYLTMQQEFLKSEEIKQEFDEKPKVEQNYRSSFWMAPIVCSFVIAPLLFCPIVNSVSIIILICLLLVLSGVLKMLEVLHHNSENPNQIPAMNLC